MQLSAAPALLISADKVRYHPFGLPRSCAVAYRYDIPAVSVAELFERLELQRKIDANYKKSLALLSDSAMKTVIIDGRGSIKDIHSQICRILDLTV